MNPNSSNETDVPHSIAIYQAAHDRRDVPTAIAQFAVDARVVDDGRTYEGISGAESFFNFPGGHVDLSYEFQLVGGLIASLTIAP